MSGQCEALSPPSVEALFATPFSLLLDASFDPSRH